VRKHADVAAIADGDAQLARQLEGARRRLHGRRRAAALVLLEVFAGGFRRRQVGKYATWRSAISLNVASLPP
jgi:hypothetical protein